MTDNEEVCYICYDPAGTDKPFCKEPPCSCTGSLKIHASCLVTLRSHGCADAATHCGICKQKFAEGTPGQYRQLAEGVVEEIKENYHRHRYHLNKEGQIHGKMCVYYPSGRLQASFDYLYGEMNGYIKTYYDTAANTLRQVVRSIAGLYEDVLTMYYENGGILREIPYKGGERHGTSVEYSPNGQIVRTSDYAHDVNHGYFLQFYETVNKKCSIVKLRIKFEHGTPVWAETYTEAGTLIEKRSY
jgi:hypothetical protein